MEYVYKLQTGRRVVVYDEDNFIYLAILGNMRNVQLNVLSRDYLSDMVSFMCKNEIFVGYINVNGELIISDIGRDGRLVLKNGIGDRLDIHSLRLFEAWDIIYMSYIDVTKENCDIKYIAPYGDRKVNTLVRASSEIKEYYIEAEEGTYNLRYRTENDGMFKRYELAKGEEGSIIKEEMIILREKNVIDIKNKLEEKEQEIEDVKKIFRAKEDKYRKNLDDLSIKYKTQYEELGRLTKDIQEEGKKWRDLYYNSIKKK